MIEHEEMAQEEGGDETEQDQEDSEEEEEEGMWIDDNEHNAYQPSKRLGGCRSHNLIRGTPIMRLILKGSVP